MTEIEAFKRECLERWRARKPQRRRLAYRLMLGLEEWSPTWPNWAVYDLRTEIRLIEKDRAQDAAWADRMRRARAVGVESDDVR